MKNKIKKLLALFLIELVLILPIHFVYALSITNVNSTASATSASITWQTDEVANGKIRYGPTDQLGYTRRHTTYIYDHEIEVSGLNSETTYYYEIESQNVEGDTLIKNNNGKYYAFTTKDITPPDKVLNLSVVLSDFREIRFSWDKLNASDLKQYQIYKDNFWIANSTDNFYHAYNLTPGTQYQFRVSAADKSGNEGTKSDAIFVKTKALDKEAPYISGIRIADMTIDSVTLAWNTDEKANSALYYWTDAAKKIEIKDAGYELNHSAALANLLSQQIYTVVINACDLSKNCINASPFTFKAGIDIYPPYINATLPRYVNSQYIDIPGKVEPNSQVEVYVNDFSKPKKTILPTQTTKGTFEFRAVQIQSENYIRLVAKDDAGNVNEITHRLTLDSEDPILVIDNISSTLKTNKLDIVGTVNEPITMNLFLRYGSQMQPHKVNGLRIWEDDDALALEWNETSERDQFSHYLVYRSDVGPIAMRDSQSRSSYKDTQVNKGEEYHYYVTQIDKFGLESEPSQAVSLVLPEGKTGVARPFPIDKKIIVQPTKIVETNFSFSESLQLMNDDGEYTLVIEALDRARNRILIERKLTLDTLPPTIEVSNPPPGTLIYENYADDVDIRGLTEPNARVHLFVDRTPFYRMNGTIILTEELKRQLENISDSEFEKECTAAAFSYTLCQKSADFSVSADGTGNFEIPHVDITNLIDTSIDFNEINAVELNQQRRLTQDRVVSLIFIVTDKSGLRMVREHQVRLGTCWTTNQDWGITPLSEYQSPTFLSVQRLAENKETINFFFKYEYHGSGQRPKVTSIAIDRACSGTDILGDARFNVSCQIMPSGGVSVINDKGDHSFTTLQLGRLPGMDKYLQADWEGFFKAINNELTFPMRIKVSYQYEENGKRKTAVQSTCQEVTFVLDNSLIDPRNVLPDFLLYDFVNYLQSATDTVNKVNEQVRAALHYVVIGCVSSFFLRFTFQGLRRFAEFNAERKFAITEKNPFSFFPNEAKDAEEKYCKQITLNIMRAYNLGITDSFLNSYPDPFTSFRQQPPSATDDPAYFILSSSTKIDPNKNADMKRFQANLRKMRINYFSDADLKRCFPDVYSSWETEETFYRLFRYSCDRVFGHKTPSQWTENRDDRVLQQKLEAGETCQNDESVRGQALRGEDCDKIAPSFSNALTGLKYVTGDICVRVQVAPNSIGLFKIDRGKRNGNVLEATSLGTTTISGVTSIGSLNTIYLIEGQNDRQYFFHYPLSCSERCGLPKDTSGTYLFKGGQQGTVSGPNAVGVPTGSPSALNPGGTGSPLINLPATSPINSLTSTGPIKNVNKNTGKFLCMPTNDCRQLKNNPNYQGNGKKLIDKSSPMGYTQDCYYNAPTDRPEFSNLFLNQPQASQALRDIASVSDDPNLRYECCCINARPIAIELYYGPNDINRYKNDKEVQDFAHQSKTEGQDKPSSWENMKWSYRYSKIAYQAFGSISVTPTDTKVLSEFDKNVIIQDNRNTIKKSYNPNRYMEGRDYPACFGQNSLWYEKMSADQLSNPEAPGELLIIDSRQQHTSMLQCVNIGGIGARLQMMSNLMTALSTCLIDIRTKGTSDSAACKEIFTRYVCDTVWELISMFANQCSAVSEDGNTISDEDDFFGTVRGGVSSVTKSLNDVSREVATEYGNVQLNNLLGVGGSGIARKVCLAAFGYDWDLSLDDIVDAAYSQTFASFVQATTSTREYLAIEPSAGRSRHEYRSSWVINPGCNIESYRVQLACVTRNEQARYSDIRCGLDGGATARCDCLDSNLASEKLENFYSSTGRITQNKLVQGASHKVVPSLYRFDHFKFTLIADSRLKPEDKKSCFPTGHESGVFYFPIRDKTATDILGCVLDAESGVFDCSSGMKFFNEKGLANIVDIQVNGRSPTDNIVDVAIGDRLQFAANIRKTVDSPLKCLMLTLDKRDGTTPQRSVMEITNGGTSWYGPVEIASTVTLAPTSGLSAIQMTAVSCKQTGGAIGAICPINNIPPISLIPFGQTNSPSTQRDITFSDSNTDRIIDLSKNSQDTMRITPGSGTSFTIGPQNPDIFWDNDRFVFNFDGGNLRLALPATNSRISLPSDVSEVTYRLGAGGIGLGSRTWLLSAALYEASDQDDYVPTNCLNVQAEKDPVKFQGEPQKRDINIRINSQLQNTGGTTTGGPRITITPSSSNIIPPSSTAAFEATIRIEDSVGLNKPSYQLISPQGKTIQLTDQWVDKSCSDNTLPGGTPILCPLSISVSKLGELEAQYGAWYLGGTYRLRVTAYNNQGKSSLNDQIQFNIQCGHSTQQATCRQVDANGCPAGEIIGTYIACANPSEKCCA